MNWLLKAITTGVISFAATNIDDWFVLIMFFGQAHKHRWRVVLGQYLGFIPLVGISLGGYFGRLIIHPAWIGLLGVVPIFLGIRALVKRPEWRPESRSPVGVLSVAAVTFANGGDNIGIYTPLFASSDLMPLLVIVAVFLLMLAVWCIAGYFIGRHPVMQEVINRYGHLLVPFVLIGLGIYIIAESDTLKLLGLR